MGLAPPMLPIAGSMFPTPMMMELIDRLASRSRITASAVEETYAELDRHVVAARYEEVGRLTCLMLESAKIPDSAASNDEHSGAME